MNSYQLLQKGTDISTIELKYAKLHQNIVDAYKSTIMAMAAAINDKSCQPLARGHSECIINEYRNTIKAMAATIDAVGSDSYRSAHNK
ncbi:hypothetical protein ACFLXF_00370 [Chloroflexota bacterium]